MCSALKFALVCDTVYMQRLLSKKEKKTLRAKAFYEEKPKVNPELPCRMGLN